MPISPRRPRSADRRPALRRHRSLRVHWPDDRRLRLQRRHHADVVREQPRSDAELCGQRDVHHEHDRQYERLHLAAGGHLLYAEQCANELRIAKSGDFINFEFYSEKGAYEGWRNVFLLGAGIYIVPAVLFMCLGSASIQPWDAAMSSATGGEDDPKRIDDDATVRDPLHADRSPEVRL